MRKRMIMLIDASCLRFGLSFKMLKVQTSSWLLKGNISTSSTILYFQKKVMSPSSTASVSGDNPYNSLFFLPALLQFPFIFLMEWYSFSDALLFPFISWWNSFSAVLQFIFIPSQLCHNSHLFSFSTVLQFPFIFFQMEWYSFSAVLQFTFFFLVECTRNDWSSLTSRVLKWNTVEKSISKSC